MMWMLYGRVIVKYLDNIFCMLKEDTEVSDVQSPIVIIFFV